MDLFDSFKINLYKETIQYCQRPFSLRMKIKRQPIAYVQAINRKHQPIQRHLQEGLDRIEQAYRDAMKNLFWNVGIAAGSGLGIGSIVFGVGCALILPGSLLAGAAFGALFGGSAGALTGGILTQANASIAQLNSLKQLFRREVRFVERHAPALNHKLRRENHRQLRWLHKQFEWVSKRVEKIEEESGAERIGMRKQKTDN